MSAAPLTLAEVTANELTQLCLLDSDLYCRSFFPSTFRQDTPEFHREMWSVLEDRAHRFVALEVFRGGAKTTLLRAFTSKRIAYGISRTIILVGEAQDHACKSLDWIKTQVVSNSRWSTIFALSKGGKWADDEIEINSGLFGITIAVKALGITGQIRGLNIKGHRPDLIVGDDLCDEENTATPEQRKKIADLFFGALAKSLTPSAACPDAKMVFLQTPLNQDDLINLCQRDKQWASRKFGCFDSEGNSRWPSLWPTQVLQDDKEAHIGRGQLPLWLREMECTIVSGETADLKEGWLKYWEPHTLPKNLMVYIGIDPVPPPSEKELATGLITKDSEVISAIGLAEGNYYLLEYASNKGHTPEWTKTEFFRMVDKWRPIKARVEGVAYQRTLKWILEAEMRKRGRYIQLDAVTDKRKKRHRIIQSFSGIASQGRFYCHRQHFDFIQQFASYPNCRHDDVVDSVSMAVDAAIEMPVDMEEGRKDESSVPDLDLAWRLAP